MLSHQTTIMMTGRPLCSVDPLRCVVHQTTMMMTGRPMCSVDPLRCEEMLCAEPPDNYHDGW